MTWEKSKKGEYEYWIGKSERLCVQIIPELGSKIISLKDRLTGREWLWRGERPFGGPGYGLPFNKGDGAGWDEMFPSINQCLYSHYPWCGIEVPDHGEVWSIPWDAKIGTNGLSCSVHGIRFPYYLEKRFSFPAPQVLRMDYVLHNLSPFPFFFLWAAHPLFNIKEGMEILVPDDLSEVKVSYSFGNRLGNFGDVVDWPIAESKNGHICLNKVEWKNSKAAEKFYFNSKLSKGWASLWDSDTGEKLTIHFPVDRVPYLAIWANYGGFDGNYQVAIEPSTGFLDDLSYAIGENEISKVEGRSTYCWFLEVAIETEEK